MPTFKRLIPMRSKTLFLCPKLWESNYELGVMN